MVRNALIALVGAVVICTQSGCITATVALTAMVIAKGANDVDTKSREAQLVGKLPSAADEMFGSRGETLADTRQAGRQLLLYPLKDDPTGNALYAVEIAESKITAVSKGQRKTPEAEQAIKELRLRELLIGKDEDTCWLELDLGAPVAVLRSVETKQTVEIYDARKRRDLKGARYCVLRFGEGGRCELVNLIGLHTSTKKDPAKG
jgi:hypothetical protein